MDAVKFLKTLRRMCNAECRECEYGKRSGLDPCAVWRKTHPEEAIAIAEKWAKEHPVKTRQSVFLKQYPEAQIDDNDVLSVCPAVISPSHRKYGGGCLYIHKKCADCRREFWMQEDIANAQ